MSVTSAGYIQTVNIDTSTTTGMIIGQTNANAITIGSSIPGRTPSIVIDTQSTLNTQAAPAISIGTSASAKTIKIGNSTNTVVVSAITFGAETINNFTGVTGSGNIAIGNLMTSGSIGIGNSSSRTGQINIGAGATSSGQIAIGSGGSSIVNIRIGNGGSGATGTIQLGALNVATGIVGQLNISQPITLYTLPNANTSTSTLLNTSAISFTFGATTTFVATKVGDTYVASLGSNSPVFIEGADTSVMIVILQNTGVYMLSYSVRFSATASSTPVKTVQAYILSGTATNAYSIPYQCQYASNIQTYPSPFAAFLTTQPAFNGSTTAFINGANSVNNAVTLKTVVGYGSANSGGQGCFIQGGTANNYMIITRIA